MALNILLTGASGQFGQAFLQEAASHQISTLIRPAVHADSLPELRTRLTELRPEILIHAAANTDVEGSEQSPEQAWRDNVMLTQLLIDACRSLLGKFVYLSSTGIYGDGRSDPHQDFDPVNPQSVHHRSKWQAEQIVRQQHPNHLILRTGWLFGGKAQVRRNFVANRLREAMHQPVLLANSRQRGNPTWLPDLARTVLALCEQDLTGTFNAVSQGVVTRHKFVEAIVAASGLPCRVEATDNFRRIAPVPDNESARSLKLELLGLDLPPWQPQLHDYVQTLLNQIKNEPGSA